MPVRVLSVIVLAVLTLPACSTTERAQGFLHRAHRGVYALVPDDLERMQFYISREVLAHRVTADGTTNPGDVVVLPTETRGRVLEAGSTWMRVAFTADGPGAVFLARESGDDAFYKLATEAEGRPGWTRVEDLPEPILIVDGQRYRIIHGANAFLLIDRKDLDRIVAERTHLQGAKPTK